jgi:hypothetical protein
MGSSKPPVTVKPVKVKSYVTSSGAIVSPHLAKHKVADKLPSHEGRTPTEKPGDKVHPGTVEPAEVKPTVKQNPGTIDEPIDIKLKSEPELISSEGGEDDDTPRHTSLVFKIPDDHGRTGFFKPKMGEVWEGVDEVSGVTKSFRQSMPDDRLGYKEVLTSDLAETMGVDAIPKTQWAKVSYEGKNGSKITLDGSIQMDAHEILNQKGFSAAQHTYHENGIADYYRWSDERIPMTMEDFEHQGKASALKNGGMDMAFFDFVIGNSDRHGNNFYVGENPDSKERTFVGIDHGLSFPSSEKLLFADFSNTLNSMWTCALVHGEDVDCSEKFKSSVLSDTAHSQIRDKLSKSKLTDTEKQGVLSRLQKVKETLTKAGSLKGKDLRTLLVDHVHGTDADGHPWQIPAPYEHLGVGVVHGGGSPSSGRKAPKSERIEINFDDLFKDMSF